MNGKTISYTKNYDSVFYVLGGNFTIKDETNKGEIVAKDSAISCYDGFLKIENCKVNKAIYINNESTVQIDNGEFLGTVIISSGNLIINDGIFRNGVEVIFEPFTYAQPTVIINDGEFYGTHAGLYIWFSYYAENVQLKGGTFKGNDEETPGIFVGGDKFDLNKLLAKGYRYDNNEQYIEEEKDDEGEIISYHTKSANKVSVEKDVLKGDVNLDGKITLADYTKILAHVKKTQLLTGNALIAADVNNDGKVTLADYTKVLAHVKKTALLN